MKSKRFIQKLSSVIIAGAMVMGLLPAAAFAAGEYGWVWMGDSNNQTSATEPVTLDAGEGTITWDPASATVTLDNATISGYVGIEPVNTDITVTVVLKGENQLTATGTGTGIYSTANLLIQSDSDASITIAPGGDYNDINAFYSPKDVTISGGSYTLFSNDYAAIFAGGDLVIKDGAVVDSNSNDAAAFTQSNMTIEGSAVVGANSLNAAAIYSMGELTIRDGAEVTAASQSGIAVLSNGTATVIDSKVTASPGPSSTAFYVDYGSDLMITNSVLDITSGNNGLYTKGGDIQISNSQITINAGGNPINTDDGSSTAGSLTITGANTVIEAEGAYPIFGDTVEIRKAAVSTKETSGTAIAANGAITIADGADVTAHTSAAMTAIYSLAGNILLDGKDTKVDAASENDSAIFARNGIVTLNAGTIKASACSGFAAIVGRTSGQTDISSQPECRIVIGENFADTSVKAAATVWKLASDATTYYADSMLVPTGTPLTDGLLSEEYVPEKNVITSIAPEDVYIPPVPGGSSDKDDADDSGKDDAGKGDADVPDSGEGSVTEPAGPANPEDMPENGFGVDTNGDTFFYEDGELQTGWVEQDDTWYYMDEGTGAMNTEDWVQVNGTWYNFDEDGKMTTGWQQVDGVWYYMQDWGGMTTGWQQVNGSWYYMYSWGGMATGWVYDNGTWYYMQPWGGMATGWQQVGGKWYYLYSWGGMAANTTIDGYVLGADGAWIQ